MPERMERGWPFDLPLLQDGALEIAFERPVTILVGENGSGKSTLLEAIAAAAGFSEQGGDSGHGPGGPQDWAPLAPALRLSWLPKIGRGFFMRAESFFNVAAFIDRAGSIDRWGGQPLHEQSHGESFLAIYLSRLSEPGLYILDEPEAALSPNRQLSFLCALHDMQKSGTAQIIMATHSPILMALPGATLLELGPDGANEVDYRETDHFKLYERFLRGPEAYLKHLFDDEADPT
ncbi:MAG: AAA family ATPase [Alphaproteobacteria bacterium]|nr:AAA family ATPase [Alphaproteobacteria bacterium]MDH5557950.1 AAA family ATPase [Alphaproteobacteria bacterium]